MTYRSELLHAYFTAEGVRVDGGTETFECVSPNGEHLVQVNGDILRVDGKVTPLCEAFDSIVGDTLCAHLRLINTPDDYDREALLDAFTSTETQAEFITYLGGVVYRDADTERELREGGVPAPHADLYRECAENGNEVIVTRKDDYVVVRVNGGDPLVVFDATNSPDTEARLRRMCQ